MVRHRQGVPAGGGSQGKAVGKQPHWTSGSQEIREMSRIKLPAVEEMVVFGRLLNGVGGSTLWAEQQPRCSALAGTLGPFFLLSLTKGQAGKEHTHLP